MEQGYGAPAKVRRQQTQTTAHTSIRGTGGTLRKRRESHTHTEREKENLKLTSLRYFRSRNDVWLSMVVRLPPAPRPSPRQLLRQTGRRESERGRFQITVSHPTVVMVVC
ncbi:uncharacterized protein PV06_04333 [Exophiala oligosperma]|uniref:Uncharacterized protein n=1 Tax=Exophiala oligosperma TaxID=215243 RepID=A0A0D2C0H6_9EURO|nr:uncharacterized protein PV06_04333 [Exophiala oligosperma]KIW43207.1 hypothetical protein PV06_04333 [Exophiala oligosperma]